MKRAIDIVLSAAALLALAPLLVLLAAAVVLDSGWPVLFGQERVGRRFRPFRIWKFRSMRVSSGGPQITAGGDSRVTRVGRFLRSTKLDEMPQFWNVLRGDMSLVGPRPEVPRYVEMFRTTYEKVLQVRPGITDLASIAFRNEEAVLAEATDPEASYIHDVLPRKLRLAEEYVDAHCAWLDLKILFWTGAATLRLSRFVPVASGCHPEC